MFLTFKSEQLIYIQFEIGSFDHRSLMKLITVFKKKNYHELIISTAKTLFFCH